MVEPAPATVAQPTEKLSEQLDTATTGQVLYQGGITDPKAATEALLAAHPDAKLAGGTLTLPSVSGGALQPSDSLQALGSTIGGATGVSSVTVGAVTDESVDIDGNINPRTKVATVKNPYLDATVVSKVAKDRLDMLFDAWEADILKSKLQDTHANTNQYSIFEHFDIKKHSADARAAADAALQADARKNKNSPRTEAKLRKALIEKDAPIKTNFQGAAGDKIAEAVKVYGDGKAKSPGVKAEIQAGVRFEHNLLLGRIEVPGTGQTTHAKYKPDPASIVKTKLPGGGFQLTFSYLPPYQAMRFTVIVDKNNLVTKTTGHNLTLKSADGTLGRGKWGESNAHEPNQAMHNAHLIADLLRGSGYKEAHNLVTTSAHYNLNEMSTAEDELADFVARKDPTGTFDLTVTVDWEKIDSAASIKEILANNPDWQGETAADIRAELATYLTGFGSQLQRVKSLLYKLTLGSGGAPKVVPRGCDVYLGV